MEKEAEEKIKKMTNVLERYKQSTVQTGEEYCKMILEICEGMEFRLVRAIVCATSRRVFSERIRWENVTNEAEMKAEMMKIDMSIEEKKNGPRKNVPRYRKQYYNNSTSDNGNNIKFSSNYNVQKHKVSKEINETKVVIEKPKELTERNNEEVNKGYPDEECPIETIPGRMVKAKPYRNKKYNRDAVREAVLELQRKQYIRESQSEWSNRLRPHPKPNGKIRICLDLMPLNELVEKMDQRIPDMERILESVQGAKYFSILDLKEGYFQIRLREQDKHKTAFEFEGKKYEFNRMPMGFKNAPLIFQKIMDRELAPWIGKGAQVYMDDILIYGKTLEEHDKTLREVMQRLKEKNLKINEEKVQLRQNKVKLLGQVIDGEKIIMPRDKKEKIMNFHRPQTKKELQSFLGTLNYHRRFIENISEKTAILYDLLREDKSMDDWSEEHEKCFKTLQEEANRDIVRYHPDYDKEFIIETDASNTGIGAVLSQIGDDGEKKIITPASRKLTETEQNYGITEKELYAVIFAVEKFDPYIRGRKFKIITDHQALEWIKKKEDFGNARIQRWLEKLQEYDFEIEYRRGEDIGEVDGISRQFGPREYTMTEDQKQAIITAHEQVGHRGAVETRYKLKETLTTWPRQAEHIKKVIENCEQCCRNKVKVKGGSEFIETTKKNEIWGIDIVEIKETYVLVAEDYFTRKMMAQVISDKQATRIRAVVHEWITQHGRPEKIATDQGKEFENKLFKEMCQELGIRKHTASVEHHESIGRVERLNRTIREYIRKVNPTTISRSLIREFEEKYNNTKHSAIGMTPNEAWNAGENEELKNANKRDSPYAKRFKKLNRERYIQGQIVAIKEVPSSKEKQKYGKTGTVVQVLDNDAYMVRNGDKVTKRYHWHLSTLPVQSE